MKLMDPQNIPPQPENIPSVPPPSRFNYLIILFIVFIILFLTGLVKLIYRVNRQTENKTITAVTPTSVLIPILLPTVTEAETINWRIIKTSDFILKYPPIWTEINLNNNKPFGESNPESLYVISAFKSMDEVNKLQSYSQHASDLRFALNITLPDNPPKFEYLVEPVKQMVIDGKTVTYDFERPGGSNIYTIDILYKKDDNYFDSVWMEINYKPTSTDFKLFNQILSTFKFLDQNQTSITIPYPTLTFDEQTSWKQYTNMNFSISFKYPENYDNNRKLEVSEINQDSTALKANQELWVAFPQSDVIILSIYKYTSNLSASVWWQTIGMNKYIKLVKDFYDASFPQQSLFKPPTFTTTTSTLDGKETIVAKGYVNAAQRGDSIITVVSNKGAIYVFEQLNQLPDNEAVDKSNKILSTVKFLN